MKYAIAFLFCLFGLNQGFGQSKGKPVFDVHQHARFKAWLNEDGEPIPLVPFTQCPR